MLWNAFILAIREIRRNVMRSFLTVLGIVIGVGSVIAMVMLGDGTTAYVSSSIARLGSNMLIVRPGQERHGPGAVLTPFELKDVTAIRREIPMLRAVAPVTSQTVKAVYGNANYKTTVYGTDNSYFTVRDWERSSGRIFSEGELKSGKAVCIIGETIRQELYDQQAPLGTTLRIGNIACEVIGTLEDKGASSFGMDQDDLIVVPLRMFQRRISGNRYINTIMLSAQEGASTEEIQRQTELLMRERRHIKKGEEDDFSVRDMKDIVATLSSTTRMLTLLLGAVAAISLLVGGIGIMNIMLVSVTERTREIGIRLAIGALEREVLLQFLVEAVVLSSLGGLIGIVFGLGAAKAITFAFELEYIVNKGIILIAFLFSTLVGIVFGFFPARKAAKMDPIEALRHE